MNKTWKEEGDEEEDKENVRKRGGERTSESGNRSFFPSTSSWLLSCELMQVDADVDREEAGAREGTRPPRMRRKRTLSLAAVEQEQLHWYGWLATVEVEDTQQTVNDSKVCGAELDSEYRNRDEKRTSIRMARSGTIECHRFPTQAEKIAGGESGCVFPISFQHNVPFKLVCLPSLSFSPTFPFLRTHLPLSAELGSQDEKEVYAWPFHSAAACSEELSAQAWSTKTQDSKGMIGRWKAWERDEENKQENKEDENGQWPPSSSSSVLPSHSAARTSLYMHNQ